MNHSSLSSELPVGPEPDRPRSALVSIMVLVGVCSALALTAPVMLRSLKVLLTAKSPGNWMPSLLELCLGLLGVLALSSVVVGSVTDLRSRLGSGRRRWRRHRRPWEEYLMESEAPEANLVEAGGSARAQYEDASFPRLARTRQVQEMPVKNPKSMATLRLVEATPWPLGSNQNQNPSARNYARVAPVTQLAFPVAVRPVENPSTPAWHSSNPAYYTPVPFSVWSYHDNLPNDYDGYEAEPKRTWLWATLFFAGVAIAATLWWRVYGIALPFSV